MIPDSLFIKTGLYLLEKDWPYESRVTEHTKMPLFLGVMSATRLCLQTHIQIQLLRCLYGMNVCVPSVTGYRGRAFEK